MLRRMQLGVSVPMTRHLLRPAKRAHSIMDSAYVCSGARSFSSTPKPQSVRRWLWQKRSFRYPTYACGSLLFSGAVVIGGLLVYDVLTYHRLDTAGTVIPNLKEAPRAGPENLPILTWGNEEEKSEGTPHQESGKPHKERLVVVGGGWATVSMLSKLDQEAYDVVVVSPNNYFLFTPLLPAVAVGTVGVRSVIESMRKLLSRVGGYFVQGAANAVYLADQLDSKTLELTGNANGLLAVEVLSAEWDGDMEVERDPNSGNMIYLPYDKLIVAPGSITNNRGVKGLEHCTRLKTISDARVLRKRLIENLEIASLPTTSPKTRERLLSFVVCGGGPTGVEIAAEILDMINEDVPKLFPPGLHHLAHVHLIQSRNHILNTYSEKISEYAENRFRDEYLDLITNAYVQEVTPEKVIYKIKNQFSGEEELREIPTGCTVWSTGIGMANFTKKLVDVFPNQTNPHAIVVDSHLRVLGAPLGTMYAMGDASTVDIDLENFMKKNFDRYDADHDGYLTVNEFQGFVKKMCRKFPLASKHMDDLDELFKRYDSDHDHRIEASELACLVRDAAKDVISFPPTAQVASQEGKYLARKLNALAKVRSRTKLSDLALKEADPSEFDLDDEVYKPFVFHSLGNVAYLGNAAAFDLPLPEPFHTFFGGLAAMYAWRSVYLSELVSLRTRVLVLGDYIKRSLWGRDLTWV
ncbi:hypothetical protein MYAM1_002607 [Malassezia yamatoensis]|uniref:EF-hand domain-containing protein n=1 Tax=Malassezia yamatoensis TaxID=253288 RepID=A0AAJ5YW79_9BASI|nr:hypothetical protein MYAM1_002607 [Malassezia yamatoensis]